MDCAHRHGMTERDIPHELDRFRDYHASRGTLSADHDAVLALQAAIAAHPGAVLQLDLEPPLVRLVAGSEVLEWPLSLPAGPRRMLVSGEWNGTAQLVAHDGELRATASRLPYLTGFAAA
jgi:3-isopropylmalate/(R)-2-methylmalate dehydratase small subunit